MASTRKAPAIHPYAFEVSSWDTNVGLPAVGAYVTADVWGGIAQPAEDRSALQPPVSKPEPAVAGPKKPKEDSVPVAAPPSPEISQPAESDPEPVVAATPASIPAAEDEGVLLPFKPVWEVDRFAWPADAERLYAAEAAYFSHAGRKLSEAAREGLRVLAVTSPHEGEGCTTLAICLARAAAEAGVRVALMDANLAAPQLGSRMGISFPHSWTDSLAGEVPLGETAIAAVEKPLTLLPLSATASLEQPADPRIALLLRSVASAVELLIIDLGASAEETADWWPSAKRCPIDAAIVVRDVRRTSEVRTMVVAEVLRDQGINAVGIAENYVPRPGAAEKAAA